MKTVEQNSTVNNWSMIVRSFSRHTRNPALFHLSEQLNCTNWQCSTNCGITGLTYDKSSAPSWMLSTCDEFWALTTEKLTNLARLLSTTCDACCPFIVCLSVCFMRFCMHGITQKFEKKISTKFLRSIDFWPMTNRLHFWYLTMKMYARDNSKRWRKFFDQILIVDRFYN